jgi:hypothetical protein
MVAGVLAAARHYAMPFAGLTHLLFGMVRLPGCAGTSYLFPHEEARPDAVAYLEGEPGLRRSYRPHPALCQDQVRQDLNLKR